MELELTVTLDDDVVVVVSVVVFPIFDTQLRSDTATQRHKVFPMCWDLVKVLYL